MCEKKYVILVFFFQFIEVELPHNIILVHGIQHKDLIYVYIANVMLLNLTVCHQIDLSRLILKAGTAVTK